MFFFFSGIHPGVYSVHLPEVLSDNLHEVFLKILQELLVENSSKAFFWESSVIGWKGK